jgi:hypothetical protein
MFEVFFEPLNGLQESILFGVPLRWVTQIPSHRKASGPVWYQLGFIFLSVQMTRDKG